MLGDGTPDGYSDVAVGVKGLRGAIGLAYSTSSYCALLSDGGVECWGGNQDWRSAIPGLYEAV